MIALVEFLGDISFSKKKFLGYSTDYSILVYSENSLEFLISNLIICRIAHIKSQEFTRILLELKKIIPLPIFPLIPIHTVVNIFNSTPFVPFLFPG